MRQPYTSQRPRGLSSARIINKEVMLRRVHQPLPPKILRAAKKEKIIVKRF